MKITWMRTGADGQTMFEDLQIATTRGERGDETPLLRVDGVFFRTGQPALDMDFHNAPRRQLVIPLGGELEVEAGDGTLRHIGTGDALLADDLDGQGHKSRFIPDGATVVFAVLGDDVDPAAWRA